MMPTTTIDAGQMTQQLENARRELARANQEVHRLQQICSTLQSSKIIQRQFHAHYYDSLVWTQTTWLGSRTEKLPLDLWVYQEILFDLRPSIVIECGTKYGGSALFLATICDLIDCGEIVTIDIKEYPNRPNHNRVTYLRGSSTVDEIVQQVRERVGTKERVLVILDSDHSEAHVSREMGIYHRFVTPGSYLIVEDTNVNGHPVLPKHGPGPMEAVDKFLRTHTEFYVDAEREKFRLTFNPRGFLRRMS